MFCTKCGFEIKNGYKFCPKCGTPAFVEKEEPKGEVKKEDVDEVAKETNASSAVSEPVVKPTEKEKKTAKANTASKAKKKDTDMTNKDYIPNPLIAKELNFEGLKRRADKGCIEAKLRLAYRYEKGIGCEVDRSKAENLISGIDDGVIPWEHTYICGFNDEICHPLGVKKDEVIECTDQDVEEGDNAEKIGVYPKYISYFNDLLLDFAYKSAYVHILGHNMEEELEILKKTLDKNLIELRNEYPELLFVNYPNNICKEIISELFLKIKRKSAKRYVPFFLLPQYSVHYIGNSRIEYPTLCEFGGSLDVHYDTKANKIRTLNLLLLHMLLSVPVKKVKFTFVDLGEKYDEDFLIKNLNPILYNNPINNEEDFLSFIDSQKERRLLIKKKYGNYPEFCNRNKCIPVPYEVFVFLDDYIDDEKWDKINYYVTEGYSIGVCCVFCNKANSAIENKTSIETISDKSSFFYNSLTSSFYGDKTEVPWKIGVSVLPQTGAFPFYGKQQRENNLNLHSDVHFLDVPMEGDYEVVLRKNKYSSANVVDKAFQILGIPDIYRNDSIIILASLSSKEACYDFIKEKYEKNSDLCDIIPYKYRWIYLTKKKETIKQFWADKTVWSLSLRIKKDYDNKLNDIRSYLKWLNLTDSLAERIVGILNKKNVIDGVREIDSGDFYSFQYWDQLFEKENEIDHYIDEIGNGLDVIAKKEWGNRYKMYHISFGEHYPGAWFDIRYIKHGRAYVLQSVKSEHEALVKYTPVVDNEVLLQACLEYINSEAEAKEGMEVQNLDFDSAAESKYETDLSTMIIPVGKAESKDADFRMDLVSHVHSFIIGQSGSGKSVFLHNIIGGAMLKYAPEDLQLYLLDFKLGGVEFNRYKGTKHVKALLVDNSDPQVTLEILRELRGSMTERGKLLRSAGVNNIGEYNNLHQEDRMPHVLVVADECHEMFKADDSIPRQVRNEISDIVIKIAKEGRSQGVHLVFATQTLSGTEISSEIINNVSDFYLLKCAQTDSERLVPNSSAITSELSTGQIYYHHVDEQMKFQAYYTDKETAEKLMAAIVEKAKDHKSNGEFYFNGAQMFYLDEAVKEQMLAVKGKLPLAFMGKAIDISQKDLYIKLNEDFSENVLLLGLNDQEQVTRTTMNLFVSLMMSAKLKHKDIAFKVIDCLNNEGGEVHELIFDLENEGYCEIIERRQRSKFFKELAQSVQNGTAEETILLILGQDRFRELKMDMELEEGNSSQSSDDEDMNILSDNLFGDSSSSSTSVRTYREALNVILDKGPDYGVHILLQIEKASNLLFEDYITPKVVFQKFKHLVMLKSDETAGVTLHLNDDIRLEKLSSDWERLRAYYYAEESDSYTLFTPYMPSKSKDIINLLKTI